MDKGRSKDIRAYIKKTDCTQKEYQDYQEGNKTQMADMTMNYRVNRLTKACRLARLRMTCRMTSMTRTHRVTMLTKGHSMARLPLNCRMAKVMKPHRRIRLTKACRRVKLT